MAFDIGSVIAHVKADISDFQNGMKQVEKSADSFKDKMDGIGSGMQTFGKKWSLFVTAPVVAGLALAVKSAGEYEQLQIAITTMLGSEEKALKLLKEVQEFSQKTPFQFTELATSTKQLLAYGFSAENVMGIIKSLGDVAAGVGQDKLPQLILAVGQIQAKGQLMGQELRQLQETGFPILGMLADHFGVTTQEIYKMSSAGEISSEVVIQMFQQATSEGGKFHDLMQSQSATTLGQFSNLKDSVGFLARDIGELLLPAATSLIAIIRNAVDWVNSLSEGKKKLIVIIAILVAAIGPLLLIIGTMISMVSTAITVATALGAVLTFLSANPIVLIIAAIVALIAIGILLYKNWDKVKEVGGVVMAFLAQKWGELKDTLARVGNQILDAIMWPFNEAKKRIEQVVNWIKDRLDFTQRHSPSILDIVKNGVSKVNEALGDLSIGANVSSTAAGAAVGFGGNRTSSAIVQISMDGAIIADAFGAGQMAELLGDAIIKRLQQQVRV